MNKPIGILGLGDLGNQLAIQITDTGHDVIVFDNDEKQLIEGLNIHRAKSEEEVLKSCSIVHWAISSKLLFGLSKNLQDNNIIILHDSVMENSFTALSSRVDSSKFAIAHWLMNDAKRVFIASDTLHGNNIVQHFKLIGLNPKLTTIKAHDVLMARSQGILAAFIDLGLRSELDTAFQNGDLTPSAGELRRVLINRELNWTQRTLESILANPELKQVAENMLVTINKNKG